VIVREPVTLLNAARQFIDDVLRVAPRAWYHLLRARHCSPLHQQASSFTLRPGTSVRISHVLRMAHT
jgi:hypothetical protein